MINSTDILEEPLTDSYKPIYAHFIFMQEQQARAFAQTIVEPEWTVNVAYAPERKRWQATVRRLIHPVFRDITVWLATLTARAATVDGERDGWGHK
jgi:hypothetical protein